MRVNGIQCVVDFWGCQLPADDDGWRRLVLSAVESMGVTLLSLRVHLFQPQGATAVAVLAESHLAIHAWPERDYVAIDVFSCGTTVQPDAGIAVLRRELRPKCERVWQIPRGEAPEQAADERLSSIETADEQRARDEDPACRSR